MSRWLSFRQPKPELLEQWPEAIKIIEELRLIGEVYQSRQELWFVPSGWLDAGLCWSKSWWNWSWVLRELPK